MVESIERCATCDRDECRSGEPRAPEYLAAAERILAANGHATLADREIMHRHARQRNAADVDCTAHRVDWRARALAAEADADSLAKASRIIDAILARLGARDTGTGGQTAEAGNARIVHDGMRRLDRAIAAAARWRKVAPLIERLADDVRRRELIARAEFDRRVSDTVTDLLAATREPTP